MITTVIFDLDDTLYDEIDYCRSGFAAVAKSLTSAVGTPAEHTIFEAFWQEFLSGDRGKIFNVVLDKLGLPSTPETIEKLVTMYRFHRPVITLPPSSKAVLDTLVGKYTLALLTDGYLPAQELKVEALGMRRYFRSIVYTEAMGRKFWKPSPAGFEHILAELGVSAETCVYVGDNEVKDFIAPNRLGFKTVKIVRPRGIHTEPGTDPDAIAGYTINDIAQLPSMLEMLQ